MINPIFLWIGGAIYLFLAVVYIRTFSYSCCITYGEYNYNFFTVLEGLLFPVTLTVLFLITMARSRRWRNW